MSEDELPLPTAEQRAAVEARLEELIEALTTHPLWGGPGLQNVHPTLYEVWDFVNRTRYRLSEFSNIQNGRDVELPAQFRPRPGKGDNAALQVFQDVCARTLMMRLFITDTTGNAAVLTRAKPPTIDFGEGCRSKLEALESVVPEGHMAAGVQASGLLDWIKMMKREAKETKQES